VDILFNAAGLFKLGTSDLSLEELNEPLAVNFFGVFNTIHAVLPTMKKQKSSHILTMVSAAGKQSHPKIGGYCASKFALLGYIDSLNKEIIKHGIKISAICPGTVNTNMTKDITWLKESERLSPEDIAKTMRFILSLSPAGMVSEISVGCAREREELGKAE
jgi:3-oxoacyl-[acyl-carrier protein] reductase